MHSAATRSPRDWSRRGWFSSRVTFYDLPAMGITWDTLAGKELLATCSARVTRLSR